MPAIIRTITRRASGRESVRLAEAAGPILRAGRDAGSDIHLPDLRVALAHLRIDLSTPGVAQLQAEGDNAFKHQGRILRRIALPLSADGAEILVGPYAVRFFAAGEGVRIDVERVQAEAASSLSRDAARAFSLRGSWLSKRVAAWGLLGLILAVGLAFPLFTWTGAGERGAPAAAQRAAGDLWLAGATSRAHSGFVEDCVACHADPFAPVADETCVTCHGDTRHHADPERMARSHPKPAGFDGMLVEVASAFGKPEGRCTSCHVEHVGAEGVRPTTQALCADCHRGLNARLPDTALGNVGDFGDSHPDFSPTLTISAGADGPLFAPRWTIAALDEAREARDARAPADKPAETCDGFDIGRPNFRGLAQPPRVEGEPGDNSGLVFPHAVHLDPDGCVTAISQRLGGAAGYGEALECADCHEPDEARALFRPVTMEKHCSACHSLVFETINGFDRELRHGQPVDVIASMLDFYQAKAVTFALAPQAMAEVRRRPGEAAQERLGALRQLAFANANANAASRVRAIFSRGGACYGCHEITQPRAGGLDYSVAPVNVRDRFLPRGAFNHRAHETSDLACVDCHAAETSRSAADVLLPGVENCQSCHQGEHARSGVASTCVMCHGFHAEGAAAPLMKAALGE